MNKPIDIVIPWVDEKDLSWEKERIKYSKQGSYNKFETSNNRFQCWDNLNLWFRAIEECMPWVHKVFLITCGHLPDFLNIDCSKLRVVSHSEYIPSEYLPTFNAGTIEMNVHRIKDLSENYIMFNDDVFPLSYIDEEYYFKDDMVCDEAVENIITTTSFGAVSNAVRYATVNNMFIINRHFKKREVQAKNPEKWFCEKYGERLERTKACEYWYDFPGFYDPHMANALKKSTLRHLWEVEPDALHRGSLDRFRGSADVTQYLIRYWQLCTGEFVPRKTEGKVFFPNINSYEEVVNAIDKGMYPMISFNENCTPDEFIVMKKAINEALKRRFPNKCSFEK